MEVIVGVVLEEIVVVLVKMGDVVSVEIVSVLEVIAVVVDVQEERVVVV